MTIPARTWDMPEERTRVVGDDPGPRAAEAPEDRVHCLVVVEGTEPGRRITLGASAITIGRVAPANLVLPDAEISRAHCRIEPSGDDVLVTDLGSTNGTYIDGRRVHGSAKMTIGAMLRVGRHLLRTELRNRHEVAAAEQIDRDLAAARSYVESLLPARLARGPVRTEWLFEPSARVGGDVLGYYPIDDDHFALYLLDVAGHGAGAALHAASVTNILRNQALPRADMRRPEQVLSGLNALFPMGEHGDMYFTAWYGVYVSATRELRYCSGGHHPGYLVGPERSRTHALRTPNLPVGVRRGYDYRAGEIAVEPGSMLYLFSDGVYEVECADGRRYDLDDFLPLLLAPANQPWPEPDRLVGEVRRVTGRNTFDDDLTLLVATFP